MHIIFCADPLASRAVDGAYTDEAQAAMGSGLEYHLISYEQLVHERDAAAAVRRVPIAVAPELAIPCVLICSETDAVPRSVSNRASGVWHDHHDQTNRTPHLDRC